MFCIPELDPGIPRQVLPRAAKLRPIQLAQTLLQAGLVDAPLLESFSMSSPTKFKALASVTPENLQLLCQGALSRWLNRQLPHLQVLHPWFGLELDDGLDEQDAEHVSTTAAAEGHSMALSGLLTWGARGGTWAVGEALQDLESRHAGLGQTVLESLERVARRTLPLVTPQECLHLASEVYWFGEEDEALALDEACGEEAQDTQAQRQEMREEMVTRDKFERLMPAWAVSWSTQRELLDEAALRILLTGALPASVRDVIRLVLGLMALLPNQAIHESQQMARHPEPAQAVGTPSNTLPDYADRDAEGYFLGYAGVVIWDREDDLMLRVVDDYEQMVGECGEYSEHCGIHRVRLHDASDLLDWMDAMQAWFAAVRQLDDLIVRLSQGNWSLLEPGTGAVLTDQDHTHQNES